MSVCAQTLLKFGSSSIAEQKGGLVNLVLSCIKSPMLIFGFGIYAVAAFLWAYSLSRFDLSYVNFVGSLSYIFVILVSIFILNETISPIRWIGCGFIMIGVIFVLRS